MFRLRFKVGPLIWEPRHTPDRRPQVTPLTKGDGVVILLALTLLVTAVALALVA